MKRLPLFFAALFFLLALSACGGERTGYAPSDRSPQPPGEGASSDQRDANPADSGKDERNGAAPPFEIAGLYFSGDGSAPMYIETTGDGYTILFNGYESRPLVPEYDAATDAVNLSGEVMAFPTGAPSEGNWRITVHLDRSWGTSASLAIIDAATNDQKTRVDGSFQKFPLRTGAYFYWDREAGEKKDLMELEYEMGRFRFTVAERYASDWLEPTAIDLNGCVFSYLPAQDKTGEHGEVQLDLSLVGYETHSYALVGIYSGDGTESLLYDTAYTIPPAEELPDYTGKYGPDPEADEAHTMVVEKDRITIDGRYTAELMPEDAVLGNWRKIVVTETATGKQQDASVSFQALDGNAMYLTVSLYDLAETFCALRP